MKPISLFILSLVVLSCSDARKGGQLGEIEQLQTTLDSLEKEWVPKDAVIVDSLSEICTAKIDSIGLLYNDEHIELQQASKIDLFKQCNNDLQELKNIQAFYPTVLKEKKQSLQLLKTDVSKGSGRREKYDEYIRFEQKELETIRQQHGDYQKTKERCMKHYSESKSEVDKLLDSLKNNRSKTEIAQ